MNKKVFIICTVRGATKKYKEKLEFYAKNLESQGYEVHLPHRDTNQHTTSLGICLQNAVVIKDAAEIHVFYSSKSQGTHFDMGMAFMAFLFQREKKIIVVENEEYVDEDENGKYVKSFARMLEEWTKKIK